MYYTVYFVTSELRTLHELMVGAEDPPHMPDMPDTLSILDQSTWTRPTPSGAFSHLSKACISLRGLKWAGCSEKVNND